MNKKVLIAVSSTGGHIYPGLAIAGELKKNGYTVFFVGKKTEIISEEDYKFYDISVIGFPRIFSLKIFVFFIKFFLSIIQSIKILAGEKPDIAIGFGGYVSFPVVLAAWIKGTRCIIHEQNFIPGLANKLSSRVADKICISFKDTGKYFPSEKVIFTGNPVRPEILNISRPELVLSGVEGSLVTIFVFGGSQGSHKINLAVVNSLEKFAGIKEKICFIHITGKSDYEMVKNAYAVKSFSAEVHKYIHNIETAYKKATLVVCRAGATTVAELIALKIPAVLIPYSYSTEGHQKANAEYLARNNCAVMIEEKQIEKFPDIILELITQPQALQKMSESYKELPVSCPAKILLELIEKTI